MTSQAEQRRAAELQRNRAQASTANLGEEEDDDDDDDVVVASAGGEPYVRTVNRLPRSVMGSDRSHGASSQGGPPTPANSRTTAE